MKRQKLSVTIITHNEENNIRDCLESVKWADEIIVIDSESNDRTVEICKSYTNKVYVNPWPGMNDQNNIAVDKASYLWILNVDADERLSDDFRNFVLAEMCNPASDGYRFPRQNYFVGKWLRFGGWYPDHVLRLFRKDKGRFAGINPHGKVVVHAGKVTTVPIPIIHYTYNSLKEYVIRQESYASIAAAQMYKNNKTGINSFLLILLKVPWKFIETFFLKRGFLDGSHGFIAAIGASYTIFIKYAKLWELKQNHKMLSNKF